MYAYREPSGEIAFAYAGTHLPAARSYEPHVWPLSTGVACECESLPSATKRPFGSSVTWPLTRLRNCPWGDVAVKRGKRQSGSRATREIKWGLPVPLSTI